MKAEVKALKIQVADEKRGNGGAGASRPQSTADRLHSTSPKRGAYTEHPSKRGNNPIGKGAPRVQSAKQIPAIQLNTKDASEKEIAKLHDIMQSNAISRTDPPLKIETTGSALATPAMTARNKVLQPNFVKSQPLPDLRLIEAPYVKYAPKKEDLEELQQPGITEGQLDTKRYWIFRRELKSVNAKRINAYGDNVWGTFKDWSEKTKADRKYVRKA